ncbi:MAG: hypothetical protein SNG38_07635 [Rikenellaceae bacterium]
MKKFTIILSAILFAVGSLQAQQVNKQVEVTKSYIPVIERAQKPILPASIIDTTYINPDVDYTITPLAINTQLQTLPIKPATVTYWEFNKPALAQLKVGFGYPLNSLFQGYASTYNASIGYLMAEVDHVGDYSKIKNELGDKVDATQTLNNVALSGGFYLGYKTLEGRVSYFNDTYNKYAFEQTQSTFVNYQQIAGALRFGDSFVDFDRMNFSVGGEFSHFYDRRSNINNIVDFEVLLSRDTRIGRMLLDVDYKGIASEGSYDNNTASLSALFETKISRWQLIYGAQYYFDKTTIGEADDPNHYFIPKVTFKRAEPGLISVFAEVGGYLQQNNYAYLSGINPYIANGLSANSSVNYSFAAGALGQTKSSTLAYRLYADYSMVFNNNFWGLCVLYSDATATEVSNNYFTLAQASLNNFSLNFELDYKPLANLSIALDAHYHFYNDYSYDVAGENPFVNSLPNLDLTLGVDYKFKDISVGVNANMIGERSFSVLYYESSLSTVNEVESLSSVVDLSAYANWKYSDKMSFFVEGSNLCNADLYPWAKYQGFGLRFTVGAKIKF